MDANRQYLGAYKRTRVLVTGGSGAIGSNFCRALVEHGATVIVLDDLSSSERWLLPDVPNCSFVQGSILDQQVLDRVFSQEPQMVFHLAALFANQNSIEHPEQDLLVNGLGTLKILQAAQTSGVDRVVYAASSSSVPSAASQKPIREESLSLELSTPYQITKLLGEMYCNFFKNYYRMKTVRLRFFNSYGPGEIPGKYRNVIPNFIHRALRGEPLPVMGTGKETRDWTYVDDIIDGLLRAGAVDKAVGEVFNLASGKETQVADLARRINDLTGNRAGIERLERRRWDSHTRRWASIDKARNLLGYEPRTDLDTGLSNTIAWFKTNWSRLQTGERSRDEST